MTDASRMTREELKDILSEIRVEAPVVKVPKAEVDVRIPKIEVPKPEVTVNVPEIKVPEIKVPTPQVKVTVPDIKIPKIDIPEPIVQIPESMKASLVGIDKKNPLPVMMVGIDGKPYFPTAGGGGARVMREAANPQLKSAPISVSTAGNNTLISAVSGKRICVTGFMIQGAGTVSVKFTNGSGGADLTGAFTFQAREGATSPSVAPPYHHFATTQNTALIINLSDAVSVVGFVSYFELE
jgi:hypothetical protein